MRGSFTPLELMRGTHPGRRLLRFGWLALTNRSFMRVWVSVLVGVVMLSGVSWPRPATTAAAVINPILGSPTNLVLTELDSTIRAVWTPTSDPASVWQVFSVWDGPTLVGAKLVARTATAADGNGLNLETLYTLKVQSMDAAGQLSTSIVATGQVDPQPPMDNAAFFESFNGTAPGDLDPNYFDVRLRSGNSDPDGGEDRSLVFANEKHFHTQVIGGSGTGGLLIRPRVPFNFAGRTGTFQFEVDLAPIQRAHGKWFEVTLTQGIAAHEHQFGDGEGGEFPNSIEFSVRQADISSEATGYNYPVIKVNVNGTTHEFVSPTPLVTYPNVRVPVVLKVSTTKAEMFVNGVSVVTATGFTLPFTQGYWNIAHRNYYAGRIGFIAYDKPPVFAIQLVHWDMIQFDGPAGSYNPVVRAYRQPGCAPIVEYDTYATGIDSCDDSLIDGTTIIQIPDNLSSARSALFTFNGNLNNPAGQVIINGHALPVPPPAYEDGHSGQLNAITVPVAWLQTGANSVVLTQPNQYFAHAVFEVIYNLPRTIENVHMHPMPMIGATSQNFRIEHINGDPPTVSRTAFLYSLGQAGPVAYTATVLSDTPWLQIVSPTTGVLPETPALGGALVPLTFQVNAAMVGETDDDGAVGYLRVTGGSMPLHIAVILQFYNRNFRFTMIPSIPPTFCQFNKQAIPNYGEVPAPIPASPSVFLPLVYANGVAGWPSALGCNIP